MKRANKIAIWLIVIILIALICGAIAALVGGKGSVQDSEIENSILIPIETETSTLTTNFTETTTTTETTDESAIDTTTTIIISNVSEQVTTTEDSTAGAAATSNTAIITTIPSTTTTTSTSTIATTTTIEEIADNIDDETLVFVKTFKRGTYYAYGGPRKGGSGRQLIDCSIGSDDIKGSIASSYLLWYCGGARDNGTDFKSWVKHKTYVKEGYTVNDRTKVYLEIPDYPSMNGYYYLDDCDAGNSEVIDFFFLYNKNCPFSKQGVVSVDCWLVLDNKG